MTDSGLGQALAFVSDIVRSITRSKVASVVIYCWSRSQRAWSCCAKSFLCAQVSGYQGTANPGPPPSPVLEYSIFGRDDFFNSTSAFMFVIIAHIFDRHFHFELLEAIRQPVDIHRYLYPAMYRICQAVSVS